MKKAHQHRNWTRGMRRPAASAAIALAGVLLSAVISARPAQAQTFTSLVSFNGTNGANPYNTSLVQGLDGNLYGTTVSGGADEAGTVFKVTPTGTLTTLHSFAGGPTDGAYPWAALLLGTDGNFYGTTLEGGVEGRGTVFRMTSAGAITVLYSFCSDSGCSDGTEPDAPLVQAASGIFYGTASSGGANGDGTVFSITSSGTLTTLHSFGGTDGQYPEAALVQATSGTFYGTTESGGANGSGTVFSITAGGTLKSLYSFCAQTDCPDGYNPQAALVQATNGTFYGTTPGGGGSSHTGTVFSITSGGALTTLYDFCFLSDCADGENPYAGLIQATNGDFYGTTNVGGNTGTNEPCIAFSSEGCGTIFEINASGVLTTLHGFEGADGFNSEGSNTLVQATNGTFYGTTYAGGANNLGTIFSLADGLDPFVKTLPTSGEVGSAVTILGTNFTGSTSVTFNGMAATFTVVSKTEITTTVPTGATTGKVKVVTPSRTLTSNVNFRVP